jgi:Gas vesicle synthesis protein GvpL/GvpF
MFALAIVEGEPPPDRTAVCADGLVMVMDVEDQDVVDAGTLLRHAEAVSSLHARLGAVLPVRVGTQVADEDEAVRILMERRDELRAALDRVRGGVEMGLRCLSPEPSAATSPPDGGHDYLRQRARAWHWVDDVTARLAMLRHVDGVRALVMLSQTTAAVKASALVDRSAIAGFRGAVADLQKGISGQVISSGPFPPYSFTSTPFDVADAGRPT